MLLAGHHYGKLSKCSSNSKASTVIFYKEKTNDNRSLLEFWDNLYQ